MSCSFRSHLNNCGLVKMLVITISQFKKNWILWFRWLLYLYNLKQLEMQESVLSTVATDALVPRHQYQQPWLNIHSTGLIWCRHVTFIVNIKKWNKISKKMTQWFKGQNLSLACLSGLMVISHHWFRQWLGFMREGMTNFTQILHGGFTVTRAIT